MTTDKTEKFELVLRGETYESAEALKLRLRIGEQTLAKLPRPIRIARSRYWHRDSVDEWLMSQTL